MYAYGKPSRKTKPRTAKKAGPRKSKFSLSLGPMVPFLGGSRLSFGKAMMGRKARAASAGRYLRTGRPTSAAGKLMSRGMAYGQSFNTGAAAMGVDSGIVCLKHREFLGVINSSTAFETNVYEINPGLDRTFPWASGIARQFQQYSIKAMVVEYISTSATSLVSGTNTALGQIAIGTQYDSVVPEFRNLNDMLNSQWATSTKISSDLLHPIECQKSQTTALPLYIRSGAAPGDIRLYDIGRFTVATYGAQASNQVGQLWVSYEIELMKPISTSLDGGNAESAFITCFPATLAPEDQFAPNRQLASAYFSDFDSIGVELNQSVGASSITLPAGSSGYYLVSLAYFGSPPPVNLLRAGTFTLTNAVLQQNFWNQSPYEANTVAQDYAGDGTVGGSNSQCPHFTWIFEVPDPSLPAVIAFNGAWQIVRQVGGNIRDCLNIVITQLNVGASNFATAPARNPRGAESPCCDDLQAQITALSALVAQLQAHEEESEEESEEEEKEIDRRFERVNHRIDECCGDSPKKKPDDDEPLTLQEMIALQDKEKKREELLAALRSLDSSEATSPNLQQ